MLLLLRIFHFRLFIYFLFLLFFGPRDLDKSGGGGVGRHRDQASLQLFLCCRIKGGSRGALSSLADPPAHRQALKKKKMWPGGETYVTPADSDQPLLLRFLQRETDKEPGSSSLAAMTGSDTAAGQRRVALSPPHPPFLFWVGGRRGRGRMRLDKNHEEGLRRAAVVWNQSGCRCPNSVFQGHSGSSLGFNVMRNNDLLEFSGMTPTVSTA